jgi:hypothetical protein
MTNTQIADNTSGFIADMRKIITDARRAQSAFLASKSMTWQDARALDQDGREALQAEYTTWLQFEE